MLGCLMKRNQSVLLVWTLTCTARTIYCSAKTIVNLQVQQFSQGTAKLSGPISSISDHSARVTAENEIAKIFGRKYFDILSSVPLSHYDTARRSVDIISTQLQNYLHNLTCWQGGREGRGKVFNQSIYSCLL